jgi:coiled-coil domain-containing protein 55
VVDYRHQRSPWSRFRDGGSAVVSGEGAEGAMVSLAGAPSAPSWRLARELPEAMTASPHALQPPTNLADVAMAFKFGLKNKLANGPNKPSLGKPSLGKKKPLLDDEDDEPKPKAKATDGAEEIAEFNFEDTLAASSAEKPAPKSKQKPKPLEPPTRKPLAKQDDPTRAANLASVREAERRAKEAEELDASIYDYDAAYEAIHAKQLAKRAAEREEAADQTPKYMDALFESAEQRKKDQLRARDKILQREREAEGDEFADKEKFVTGAYKLQQEEARIAEEEERKKQEEEEEQKRKYGMQNFHKLRLMEEEKRHQEAMEAAAELVKSGVKLEEQPKEKTDAEIAAEARAQGKDITVNEEGQVTDKRQLLSAGLNIIAKPRKPTTTAPTAAKPTGPNTGIQGRNAARNDIRARHNQMVAQQIEQAEKRKADEEAEEATKLLHASKSQKTATDISSAKERYLQRKREAAAAKAAAEGK